MKKFYVMASVLLVSISVKAQKTVDFEELTFPESQNYWNGSDESGEFTSKNLTFFNNYVDHPEWPSWSGFAYSRKVDAKTRGFANQYSVYAPIDYWNGKDGSGGFQIDSAFFSNSYNFAWNSWSGFSYSRVTDNITEGFTNQFSAIPGEGNNGSSNYGIWYLDGEIIFNEDETRVNSVYVTNSTYAYYSMLNGDQFASQFDEGDSLTLTILAYDYMDQKLSDSIVFYLADFTSTDPTEHYIINDWQEIDLSSLGDVKKLEFYLTSSDVGVFGMNTPNYFALDDLSIGQGIEERIIDFEDMAFQSSGNNMSDNYAVYYADGEIEFDSIVKVNNFVVANTTYAYYAMLEGDQFSSAFTQDDWFNLKVYGWDQFGEITDSVSFYLADFRSSDPNDHYILDAWEEVDLSSLGEIAKLSFELTSSDVGSFGMNTPNYFALDDIEYELVAPITLNIESHSTAELFSVYPNPANNIINIKGQSGKLSLIDNTGKVVFQDFHNEKSSLNVEHLPQGLYFVHLTNEKGLAVQKLVIQ